jgi:hypothetical protein
MRATQSTSRVLPRNAKSYADRCRNGCPSPPTMQHSGKLVADGLAANRNATRALMLAQLMSFSGPVDASALGTALPSSAYQSQYKSTTMSELSAVVNGVQGRA